MEEKDPSDIASTAQREQEFFDAGASRYARARKWISRSIGAFDRSDDVHDYYNPQDKIVLDYGCGTGRFAIELIRRGATRVTGIDISNRRVEAAAEKAEAEGVADRVNFLVADAHDTRLPEHSFDLIIGSDILHHLDLEAAAHEMRRLLKPNGAAVFIEPLAHHPLLRLGRRLTPSARTTDEHPLTTNDWAMLARTFPNFVHFEREFITVPLMPLNLFAPPGMQRRFAARLAPLDDRLLERWPTLRKYARRTILIMRP